MRQKILQYFNYSCKKYGLSALLIISFLVITGSLLTFNPHDISLLYHARYGSSQNMFGYFGASLAAIFIYLFGSGAYIFLSVLFYSLLLWFKENKYRDKDRFAGLLLLTITSTMFCNVYKVGFSEFSAFGGLLGKFLVSMLSYFNLSAQIFIIQGLFFISLILILRFVHLPIAHIIVKTINKVVDYMIQLDHVPARSIRLIATGIAQLCFMIKRYIDKVVELLNGNFIQQSESSIVEFERDELVDRDVDDLIQDLFSHESEKHKVRLEKMVQENTSIKEVSFERVIEEGTVVQSKQNNILGRYVLPDVDAMLSKGAKVAGGYDQIDRAILDEQSAILEEKLALFGVKGKVERVHPGPVITMFEYRPENNIKLSKIIGLEDDLAMALQAVNIRILAPIPGKSVVGFEVANKDRKPVLLSDIFHSAAWNDFHGSLPLILGENTQGEHLVLDLATMPHLLIAGSTGSGKSVALNCMLVSLLCAKDPKDLRLIIIDPKQLEFSSYEDIAHLLFPIVTDSKKAVPVLKWLVSTMEDRYELMSVHGVKNIFEYQKLAKKRADLDEMPFIVLIIDELADLMMTTGKDVEDLIARIAQMSRAAGIHMIVATQRPSVDVITGLIKVNFPNRISFKVTSKVDSRTILDVIGAERLLGKGDMLFIDSKDPEIKRAHGAYVSNEEIEFLVQHIKEQQPVEYLDISEFLTTDKNPTLLDNDQELYQEIIGMLKDHDEVSISMIQRKFRIGYNRSARIIETLEAEGHILPSDGGKMRRVVKSDETY